MIKNIYKINELPYNRFLYDYDYFPPSYAINPIEVRKINERGMDFLLVLNDQLQNEFGDLYYEANTIPIYFPYINPQYYKRNSTI